MREIVFATNNKHKLFEVQQMLGTKYSVKSLADIGFTEDIPEDFQTLEENASQKAWHIYNLFKTDCFADDTGLEVTALNGEPGVRSARYAGEQRSSHDNIIKLLAQLENKPVRDAQFRTVIALIMSGVEYRFEGIVRGSITQQLYGNDGFGYDPVFVPKGYQKTFAEMDIELKNRISHRGLAISKLVDFLGR
ncbi:MAG: RdgB/HAM1 family non-canonical purine NTP pyrophosphatase [Tenuifilaceae bacterium]|nr:RdgB/HAM1 family non-canonical purine NTP pyrophosphatase [Tenuifilaceae bacterium]